MRLYRTSRGSASETESVCGASSHKFFICPVDHDLKARVGCPLPVERPNMELMEYYHDDNSHCSSRLYAPLYVPF
ncbi:hypothetical protein Lgee_0700 [Legionella geestiana]|uniref:Uncharacterized protein n=1 Tax=Legionella geestiana TaxID=45065 RepID=A0A0W0U2R4_9GAMM|nr:hypothetical protein Lgee_0700 [Legionella geestiana]STX53117.1 Uncharacterised protein [Legionella geestiana]